jgi:hypothetical protein
MARRPVVPPRSSLRTFYVYDPGLTARDYLGGVPVKQLGDHLIVAMIDKQAEYWVRLGSIGPVPLEQVNPDQRRFLHQLSGGRIPQEKGAQPKHVIRTAVQDPNTMARKLTEGYHPAFGRKMTESHPAFGTISEEDRKSASTAKQRFGASGGKWG